MPVRRLIIAVTRGAFWGALVEATEPGGSCDEPFSLAVALGIGMAGAKISGVLLSGLFFMMGSDFVMAKRCCLRCAEQARKAS